jgi:transposase InsO family protein
LLHFVRNDEEGIGTKQTPDEPSGIFRRLHPERGRSRYDEENTALFARGPQAGGPDGSGAPGRAWLAVVTAAIAGRLIGWRLSRTAHTSFVLDAREQALHDWRPIRGLIHPSGRSVQNLSIKYTECLADAGIAPLVGSARDFHGNALAETINGPGRPR